MKKLVVFLIAIAASAQTVPQLLSTISGTTTYKHVTVSPDGHFVAWTVTLRNPDNTTSRNSEIWLLDLTKAGAAAVKVSAATTAHAEHSLAFSPDSKQIAFLSDAEKTGQLELYAQAIAGTPRKLTALTGFLDDDYSAQTNLTNAQQLVENEHVMAVVPFVSAEASGATSTFLSANKVPFIGWATDPAYLTQPRWGLPIDGSQSNPVVSGGGGEKGFDDMAGVGSFRKVRMALIAENVAPGVAALDDAAGALKTGGADVVYEGSPIAELGTTSYAPYAQAIIAAHPNVVFEVLDVPDSVGLAASLKAAGYQGAIVNGVTYLPGQLASQANEAAALDGVFVIDEFPADENNTPAVRQAKKGSCDAFVGA